MNATVAPQQEASVVLEGVTLAWPHLFQPHAIPNSGNTPKYQTTVLLPVGFDLAPLQRLAMAAATKKFGADAPNVMKLPGFKMPFHKQHMKAALGQSGFSTDPDAVYLNVTSGNPPGVVGPDLQPVLDPAKVYGGVIANVQVNCYAYAQSGARGLSFGLQNVQILRDGPRLGGGNPDPKSAFTAVAPAPAEDLDANMKALFG